MQDEDYMNGMSDEEQIDLDNQADRDGLQNGFDLDVPEGENESEFDRRYGLNDL